LLESRKLGQDRVEEAEDRFEVVVRRLHALAGGKLPQEVEVGGHDREDVPVCRAKAEQAKDAGRPRAQRQVAD
jgi:hypothetical protein